MADAQRGPRRENRDGKDRGFGRGRGGRGGKPAGARGGRFDSKKWEPLTKLGRKVDKGEIKCLEDIFKFSLPIKEIEIVDKIIGDVDTYKEEVIKVKPVQKMTRAGQRTRMKVWVLIGDGRGHIGVGQKTHKEVQGASAGAIAQAKMSLIPLRFGYWGNKIGQPHTVPMKITGKNGSVRVRLVPAPRGTGIVGASASKKVLIMAGISDCYTQTKGTTKTKGNFLFATFNALAKATTYLTPELWGKPNLEASLLPEDKNKKVEQELSEQEDDQNEF